MSGPTVMAIGESGKFEPTPASKAVSVGVIPLGPGNMCIPATIRWRADKGEGVPTRLLSVHRPNTRRNPHPVALVRFECTPFVRYTLKGVPVFGERYGCRVRNTLDAADSIFAGLAPSERRRIERAVLAVSA